MKTHKRKMKRSTRLKDKTKAFTLNTLINNYLFSLSSKQFEPHHHFCLCFICVLLQADGFPPHLRHQCQILQFPAVKMSDSFLDKTKVVSVIYYSHNSSRYISPVCAVSGPLPVNITRHKTHRAVYVMLSTYLLLVPLKMFHKEEDDRVRSLDNKCIYMSDNDCRKSICLSGCVGDQSWQGGGVSIIVFGCPSKCQGRHSTYSTLSTQHTQYTTTSVSVSALGWTMIDIFSDKS